MVSMSQKLMIIMRGVSGSGKTYTGEQKCRAAGYDPSTHMFSSDHFWIQEVLKQRLEAETRPDFDKAYWDELEFDTYRAGWSPETVSKAHDWNYRRAYDAVSHGFPLVIIDSVFTKARDMRGYVAMGEKFGYKVQIQESESSWWKDHVHMLENKQANGRALEDFARFLAGFHEGMSKKYGTKGNRHGVPLDTIRGMIRRWQTNLTPDDVMGRTNRFPS